MLDREQRSALVEKHRINSKDTGSPEVQVALLSSRISQLTEHLKQNRKDHSSHRGLIRMISRRRKLLTYLARNDNARYAKLVGALGLRR